MIGALNTDNSPFDDEQLRRLKASLEPLSAAQSQWLSGYLAGRLAPSEQAPQPAESGAPALTILYGSETGNGEGVAVDLAARLRGSGHHIQVESLDVFRPARLKKLQRAVFVMSTHGDGDPPEEAVDLFEFLNAEGAPRLPRLQFRVLALGDRSYEHFCLAGRQLHERLESLGARAFGPRIDCDVDYLEAAQEWGHEVAGWIERQDTGDGHVPPAARLSLVPTAQRWTRQQPFNATLLKTHPLTGDGSDKDVHHVELSLEGSGIEYRPGDALGVWAPNDPELVDRLLTTLKLPPRTTVHRDGDELPLESALTTALELTRLAPETLEAWAACEGGDGLREKLDGWPDRTRRAFMESRQLIDLAEAFPVRIGAQALTDLLRPLAPRSYSIASSSALVDDEVHLTVATRYSRADGARRHGVASHFLNHRLAAVGELEVFLESNRRFHLPEDPDTPLILVGAGTGIAPYRAFMQDMEARGANPDTWLLFGNRHGRTDFLYQREWLQWRRSGLLNRIDAAWSRDQPHKRYVQHLVAEQASELARWLDRGAHLYVCGALAMGGAVHDALAAGLGATVRGDIDSGRQQLADLRRARRYHKDLY